MEMYLYLSNRVASYTATPFAVSPQNVIAGEALFRQCITTSQGTVRRVATAGTQPDFYVTLQWDHISKADAETIQNFYLNTSMGYGRSRSFKWQSPLDSYWYVVAFADDLSDTFRAGSFDIAVSIRLKVLGRA